MTNFVDLYEALSQAPDERARAKIIAETLQRIEEQYPHLPDVATQGHVRESELRLQKEIEDVRHQTEQVRADLEKQIEQVRAELKTDIESVRAELKTDIERVRADLLKWTAGLIATNTAVIVAAILGAVVYLAP